jgi:hypothetical protein
MIHRGKAHSNAHYPRSPQVGSPKTEALAGKADFSRQKTDFSDAIPEGAADP